MKSTCRKTPGHPHVQVVVRALGGGSRAPDQTHGIGCHAGREFDTDPVVIPVLEDFEATGASAEITSAVPLTDQEKDTIRKDIISKAGSQTVSFRVDPAILGGLVVKIGDKVLDGSVSGKMENMRQSLS